MKVSKLIALRCFAASVLAAGVIVRADDEDAIAKSPAAVQATVKKILGDKKCEGFDKEDFEGKPAYEVNYKLDGADHATLISEVGDVLQEEADIDLDKVPAAVLATATKAHADRKVTEAAIVTEGDKKFYELDMKVGDDTHEIKLNMDGTLVSDSIEKPEAGEKDSGEKKDKEDKD